MGAFDVFKEELAKSHHNQSELASGSYNSLESFLSQLGIKLAVEVTSKIVTAIWDWLKKTFGTKK